MQESSAIILEKICSHVFKETALSYFITDVSGKIIQWGGNLDSLNLKTPEKDSRINDVVVFMEGILPLKTKAMEFSCIKMPATESVDAFLFKMKKGYGLIIWDATKKEDCLIQTQQKCNELSLLIEKQKNRIVRSSQPVQKQMREPFLEALFHALNFAVLEMNEQGHFVLIGTPPPWIEHIPQSSRILSGKAYEEDVFSFLGNFIQEAKPLWVKNKQDSFKSGIWIEKDQIGQELLFEATAVDIQGRKLLIISHDTCHPNEKQAIIQKGRDLALNFHQLQRSDKKLKNMHDELELRVKERTKDLEEANLKLARELKTRKEAEKEREEMYRQLRQSQKMEAIGTLSGGIAHDFNNILSAIIGFTELSIAEARNESTVKPKLEKILSASNRAKDLVRQILMFSHQTEYEKKPVKLKQIVSEALTLLKASLPALIDITFHLESNAYILADPTQIHQVVMNLCTNAWQAMKENGGSLSVALKDTDILCDAIENTSELVPGKYVLLTVSDTGHGISPEVIERIFDPYFTTKDNDKGTGLGLSVVHGIVNKCHGAVEVKSQAGKGSTFSVYFPAFDAQDPISNSQASLHLGCNERILFVDDEAVQTEMAEELLNRLGYSVVTSNDSVNALNIFLNQKDTFDLVITDLIMPKMSGSTLAKKILDIRPDIPIILCSGYSDDMSPDAAQTLGINQYLMKPIGMQELADAIKTALLKKG